LIIAQFERKKKKDFSRFQQSVLLPIFARKICTGLQKSGPKATPHNPLITHLPENLRSDFVTFS